MRKFWRRSAQTFFVWSMALSAHGQTSSQPPSQPPTKTIIFVGDSLAQGYGVEEKDAFPEVAGRWLNERGHRVQIVNGGTSGALSSSAEPSLKWHRRAANAIVVFELGANDGMKGTPAAEIKANLARGIDAAKTMGFAPALLGMKMFRNLGPAYASAFDAIYPGLAKDKKIPLMPFLLDGVAAQPALNQADGKHPNAAGHKIIGENVAKFLEKIL